MVTQNYELELVLNGSDADQALVNTVLRLLRIHGQFMSSDAPVRVTLSSVVGYLEKQGEADVESRLRAAIAANPAVLSLDESGAEPLVATTRAGRRPTEFPPDEKHSFVRRLMTPQPKPEAPIAPRRERARVDVGWSTIPTTIEGLEPGLGLGGLFDLDEEPLIDEPIESPIIAPAEKVEAAEEEAFIPAVLTTTPEPVVEPAPEPTPEPETAPAVAAVAAPEPEVIEVVTVRPTDVSGLADADLAAAIRERLSLDPRVATFGDQWMMEERTPRFGRGDMRRFREYLVEQEQPKTDEDLVLDVLNLRKGAPDFEVARFAVNFRLSREKEFEFVGVPDQRFWSTSSLPALGTKRRKPNELGADYRFLLDETANVAPRSQESVDHTLTFFEFTHGLLPLDADIQSVLPAPMLPGQRTAVLTFESPQTYVTYLVEVRYPTPNRGGFILGLDDFFADSLVPGAMISLNRTDNDGQYRIEYIVENQQSERLLELDERRSQRYVFRPTSFSCGVDPEMLLSEDRFGRLNGDKPLEDKIRRRPEAVIAATFERIGDDRGGNYAADFTTLFAGVKIERPISQTLLRSILDHDDTGAFSRDPEGNDTYTYVPGTTP